MERKGAAFIRLDRLPSHTEARIDSMPHSTSGWEASKGLLLPLEKHRAQGSLLSSRSMLSGRNRCAVSDQGFRHIDHIVRPPESHLERAIFIFPEDHIQFLAS